MNKPTLNQINVFNENVESRELRGANLIAYKKTLNFTPEQKEIIVGTLLGDACMPAKKANTYIKFEQNYTQTEYINHLYDIFKPFVGTGPKLRLIKNAFHRDYGVSCWFRTYAHIQFKYYENLFYKRDNKGKRYKIVPNNIHQMLTLRALAYWFMDDGSRIGLNNGKSVYRLNTQGFTRSDQEKLVQVLKKNFNLNFNVVKDRHYYRLDLQVRDSDCFKKMVEIYIYPTFQYKL